MSAPANVIDAVFVRTTSAADPKPVQPESPPAPKELSTTEKYYLWGGHGSDRIPESDWSPSRSWRGF
jgi:hypothetical protein